MTLVYRPEPGCQGSYMQARREAEALAAALRDPATFAAVLREYPDAATGITEAHATEVGLAVERVDGALTITAFERDSASLEA